jgi:large subunit ribosomal protein L22
MEVTAKARYVIVSPKKVWRITRELRGMDYKKTQELLREMNLKAARILEKLLKSAFYNAQQKDANLSEEDLFIKEIAVTGGPAYKRMTKGKPHWVKAGDCKRLGLYLVE